MKKRVFALFTAMFLLCGMLAGCGPTGSSSTTTDGSDDGAKDTLIVAIPESPTYMDPMVQASIGTYRVTTQMFDRLVMMDNDMNLVPGLAESWEVIDDTTTVFHLRQGVKFHNGEEMTSEDVKYSLERCIANPGVNYNYLIIESITCDDDYTVTIKTSAPFNALLYRLSLDAASIICKSADTSAEEFNKNPVGTGPFKFVSRAAQDSIVLEKFDEYWGTPAQLDQVTFKIIENADSLLMSLQSGAIDLCAHLTSTQVAQLGEDFDVAEGTMNLVQALYLNNAVEPFDNELVRQALCYAIDKQAIIDLAFDGYGSPIGSSMYPAFGKYFDESLTDYYPHDTEKAKELLAQAGYPDGFSMTITVPSNYKPHMDTAQVLVQQLAEVGITAEIQAVEWESWVSDAYTNRQFQSTVVGVDASNMTARALLERFTSTADNNFINYSNADYDALFAQAQATADDAEQTALYKEMEKNLTEHAANVYIQDLADLVAVRKGLEGVTFYPIYVLDLSGIHYTA